MDPWPFIIAAYAVTVGATLLTTLLALRAVNVAETRAKDRSDLD